MRDPYQVFETGYLSSPGRSPESYIESSIRDLAKLTLGRQFKGIILESS